jgi:hypothetical protein
MAADLIVLLHFLYVVFVVAGGLLAVRWRWVVWLHVPAVAWGVLIEYTGWICPLTPLEHQLRATRGRASYEGDFIARYMLPLLYPDGLTRRDQIILGTFALAINLAVYGVILLKGRSAAGKDI